MNQAQQEFPKMERFVVPAASAAVRASDATCGPRKHSADGCAER